MPRSVLLDFLELGVDHVVVGGLAGCTRGCISVLATRSTLGCLIMASARPSSQKHFIPYRNDVRFSAELARTMSPSVRSTSDDGRYSVMATGTPASSNAR